MLKNEHFCNLGLTKVDFCVIIIVCKTWSRFECGGPFRAWLRCSYGSRRPRRHLLIAANFIRFGPSQLMDSPRRPLGRSRMSEDLESSQASRLSV